MFVSSFFEQKKQLCKENLSFGSSVTYLKMPLQKQLGCRTQLLGLSMRHFSLSTWHSGWGHEGNTNEHGVIWQSGQKEKPNGDHRFWGTCFLLQIDYFGYPLPGIFDPQTYEHNNWTAFQNDSPSTYHGNNPLKFWTQYFWSVSSLPHKCLELVVRVKEVVGGAPLTRLVHFNLKSTPNSSTTALATKKEFRVKKVIGFFLLLNKSSRSPETICWLICEAPLLGPWHQIWPARAWSRSRPFYMQHMHPLGSFPFF